MPEVTSNQGLHVPSLFWGVQQNAGSLAALRALVASIPDAGDPHGPWFIADNLITYGHTRGFLSEARFVASVQAERPSQDELSIAWRTHTLCWAAESCRDVPGDFVECGCCQGYSMAVVLRYLAGLPGRHLYLYDPFEPTGVAGEGKRLPAHSPDLFERVRARFSLYDNVSVIRGKVPDVLASGTPDCIAFLHIDMNNAVAERGALDVLFDRVSPGGMIVFDDYGWTGCGEQRQSADTFMATHALAMLELPTGQGLVVKR